MTLRGYTRPKKDSKKSQSSRRHSPLRLDRGSFHDGPGRDYASFAAAQAARMQQDPRSCLRRPPPGMSERVPFAGGPYGVRFQDQQALAERLEFMNLGPDYPGHGEGMPQMPHGPPPESAGYSGLPKCITLRSKDFTDREVAAMYVAHFIRHGSETWVFKFPDEENTSGGSEPGPPPEQPAPVPQHRQRRDPGIARMKEQKFGPFGRASKRDE
ncbi:uncharacterized protein PAC_06031 [Phialocephala subalpina]|uniref:Uncharacterized protein n=1 Tax=Phialocephala subalpina TaxID=576137 RepID=A0A1L7WTR6_9HELO|nr:uncharacterized protein PAC_06031 [Phialocephala subalpina]